MNSPLLARASAHALFALGCLATALATPFTAIAASYGGPVAYALMDAIDRQAFVAAYETQIAAGDSAAPLLITLEWLAQHDSMPANASSLRVLNPWIRPGARTLLSWNSPGADTCIAHVGWAGALPSRGTAIVGPISDDTAFVLTCTGVANGVPHTDFMITFLSTRQAHLSWEPVASEADSIAPDSSGGFRISYGMQPYELSGSITLADPAQREHTLVLAPGTYHFRIATLDAGGAETSYSNIASKEIE